MRYYDPEAQALSSLCELLSAVADGFPDKAFNAYAKKQRQAIISNLIEFAEVNACVLTAETAGILNPYPDLRFDDLREILRAASTKNADCTRARRDEWIAFARRFDAPTETALIRYTDNFLINDCIFSVYEGAESASLMPDHASGYRQTLHLENPIFSGNFNADYEMTDAEIEILENGYRLSFVQMAEVVTVDFSGVCLETQLIDYTSINTGSNSPWQAISDALTALEDKKDVLGMEFLNEKEKRLLPLCKFSPIHHSDTSGETEADELFLELARRVGNDDVAALTLRYAHADRVRKKKKADNALRKALSKPSSEALARMIMAELKEASACYPTEAELDVVPESLELARYTVAGMLCAAGYEGEYPHFRRMSSLKGFRLLDMQGQPMIVGNEKHMASMIDCSEMCINHETPGFHLAVSTVFLKKRELHLYYALDGYSGFFQNNRRRCRTIFPFPFWDYQDIGEATYDLEQAVTVAIKTAECGKLTKEERRAHISVTSGNTGILYYGTMFLALGALFGLLMCLGMFLVCLVVGTPFAFFSADTTFAEFVRFLAVGLPWLPLFLFSAMGFGLPMTIITAFSKKRG